MTLENVKKEVNKYGILFYNTKEEKHFNKIYYLLKPLYENILYRYYVNALFEKDEIISETFILIFKYIDGYNEDFPSFYNWANTIFTNTIFKYIKRHKKTRTNELIEHLYDIPIEDEALIHNKDKGYLIEKILEYLNDYNNIFKDKGALIFVDKWMNGMIQEELCVKYDLKLCQIKNRMHKVKLFLIDQFERDLNIVLKKRKYGVIIEHNLNNPNKLKGKKKSIEHCKHISEAKSRYYANKRKEKALKESLDKKNFDLIKKAEEHLNKLKRDGFPERDI